MPTPECPTDIEEFGVRHGIPEFSKATWGNGYRQGAREERAQIIAALREPSDEAMAQVCCAADQLLITAAGASLKDDYLAVLHAFGDWLEKQDG